MEGLKLFEMYPVYANKDFWSRFTSRNRKKKVIHGIVWKNEYLCG